MYVLIVHMCNDSIQWQCIHIMIVHMCNDSIQWQCIHRMIVHMCINMYVRLVTTSGIHLAFRVGVGALGSLAMDPAFSFCYFRISWL